MLSRTGSNRSPIYQLDRRYGDRTPNMRRITAGSLVTRSLGPTRARVPECVRVGSCGPHHVLINLPYLRLTSKKSRCIVPPATQRVSHNLERLATNGPLKCRKRYRRETFATRIAPRGRPGPARSNDQPTGSDPRTRRSLCRLSRKGFVIMTGFRSEVAIHTDMGCGYTARADPHCEYFPRLGR